MHKKINEINVLDDLYFLKFQPSDIIYKSGISTRLLNRLFAFNSDIVTFKDLETLSFSQFKKEKGVGIAVMIELQAICDIAKIKMRK